MKYLTSLSAGVAMSALALTACASGGRTEGPTVPVDVIVKNNLLLPTDITVYAVAYGGHRTLLGSVHPQDSATFTFKPVSFSEQYRLLAIRSRGRDIRSEVFSVESDMTGAITWMMVPNIIQLRGVDADSGSTAGADSSGATL